MVIMARCVHGVGFVKVLQQEDASLPDVGEENFQCRITVFLHYYFAVD